MPFYYPLTPHTNLLTNVLQAMVTEQTQLLSGERIELLAIFSNPSLRHVSANLGPHLTKAGGSAHLQLGRELKSLLRSVPSPYVFVEPAATLEDVRSAVEEHNPQIAIFSGHSLVGSLVLELPDGSVDLPLPTLNPNPNPNPNPDPYPNPNPNPNPKL